MRRNSQTSLASETSEIVDTTKFVADEAKLAEPQAGTGESSTKAARVGASLQVGDRRFQISASVVKSPAFQHSHLATILTGMTPRGETVERNAFGEVMIPYKNPAAFGRVLAHLHGQSPLETASLKDVSLFYEELLAELIHWRLPRQQLVLPARLWTQYHWTDLSAFYALDHSTRKFLYARPVAVQLAAGENPTPIQTAVPMPAANMQRLIERVDELASLSKPTLYSWKLDEIDLVLVQKESWTAYIQHPSLLDRVLSFCLPADLELPISEGPDQDFPKEYPYKYEKDDKVTLQLNTGFGVELEFLSSGRARVTTLQSSAPVSSQQSSWLYGSREEARADWCCYHPEIEPDVKYSPQTRVLSKDALSLSQMDIRTIRFFPWGSLIVSNRVESLFAVITVDQSDMAKIYGSTIGVYLKGSIIGTPAAQALRSCIDVTVASDLSRIYLLLCGQLTSQTITPMSNRVAFEVHTPQKSLRAKLCHIDIPDGGPENIGDLHCLGTLASFDPSNDLYYQAAISETLCHHFKNLVQSKKAF